jgi:bacillithiol synthase
MSTTVVDVPSLNLTINVEPLRGSALIRDFYDAASALAPFYPGSPWDPAAWPRVASDVREYFTSDKLAAMRPAIRAGSANARAKLDRIVAGDGFFVQTGQQAGLFGGPLYTVYKIISAIRLAEQLEQQLEVPVAPLFWIAADDHDFAEVDHAVVVSESHELHTLELRNDLDVPVSMHRRALGNSVASLIEQLPAVLAATPFADELISCLRQAYRPDATVANAFENLIAFLFDRCDLLITSSAHPTVKQLMAPLVAHELANSEAHEDAVNNQTQKLVSLGYHEQVPVRSDAANVSFEDENGRDRLMKRGTDWELSRSKKQLLRSEIDELLRTQPERFSANALFRPVVASAVFPTIAYVGGPAEISYFAQIGCLFDAHAVPMPMVVPRMAAEVVEYKVQKVLNKFRLQPGDVRVPFDRLSTSVIRREVPPEITEAVERLRELLRENYDKLLAGAVGIDPTLKAPVELASKRSEEYLARMDKKIVQHLKRRNSVELQQLRRAADNLYPQGQGQERVLCVLTYYARYGSAFINDVANRFTYQIDRPAPEWTGVVCK